MTWNTAIKWIMLVSGALTLTMVYVAIAPEAVSAEDLRILARADALLKDESVWNRQDDRECQDDEAAGKRSCFVLSRRRASMCWATTSIGAPHCRRCASPLRTPRAGGILSIGYGTSTTFRTRFHDIKRVVRVATERVTSRLKAARQP